MNRLFDAYVEPIKVLHCLAGNLYGGVETFVRTLAECHAHAPALNQEFALCFEGRLDTELRAAGATVHQIGGVRFSRPWSVWKARKRLASLLRARRINVVVNHACWPQMLCGPTARRAGQGVVFWMHDMIGDGGHWVERRAAQSVPDLVIANSQCTAATLPRLYPNVACEVVRYPVRAQSVNHDEARVSVRTETATPLDDVVIVTSCRLETWKGHRLLLAALASLKDKPGWTAWIAGGPQRPHEQIYLDELQDASRAGEIDDRIRWLGQRGDVPRVLAAADIHCQPNLGPEPFGIAFVEALYAGLPVVSTRMGGAAEIVTDECGRLTPPDDAESLAAVLAGLIDDRDLRARLGAAGPARAAALCAPETVLPRLEQLLGRLCARPVVS